MAVPNCHRHIIVVFGPAGCGKSTVAQRLAVQMRAPYVEGDEFHSATSKGKMENGIALEDADRWDWLTTLRTEALGHLRTSGLCVVACSALKKKYRDVFRVANYEHPFVHVQFIFLRLDEALLQQRLIARIGHYMKEGMIRSQMNAFEKPDIASERDIMEIDATMTEEEIDIEILSKLRDRGFDTIATTDFSCM